MRLWQTNTSQYHFFRSFFCLFWHTINTVLNIATVTPGWLSLSHKFEISWIRKIKLNRDKIVYIFSESDENENIGSNSNNKEINVGIINKHLNCRVTESLIKITRSERREGHTIKSNKLYVFNFTWNFKW